MSNPPAGWYPNPENPAEQRYWDGEQWTQHTAPAAAQPAGWGAPPAWGAGTPAGTQQPYGGYYPQQRGGTNGFAVASLVLGIVWVWWIGSVLAIVFGFIAKRQIDDSGGVQQGRGMAIAGIVLGFIGVGVVVLLILAGFISAAVGGQF